MTRQGARTATGAGALLLTHFPEWVKHVPTSSTDHREADKPQGAESW